MPKMTEAKRLAQRKRRAENPDYDAKWRAAHPGSNLLASLKWQVEHRDQVNANMKIWRIEHPGAASIAAIKSWKARRVKLAKRKKPKYCDVCKKSGNICFDHDHTIDLFLFRGWICFNCNSALGYAKDSAKLLRKLAAYLERPLKYRVVYSGGGYMKKADRALIGPRPGQCQVCRQTGRICIDHCHKKNLFRGWLCSHCNSVLGHVHDSPKLLRKLADYLDVAKRRVCDERFGP